MSLVLNVFSNMKPRLAFSGVYRENLGSLCFVLGVGGGLGNLSGSLFLGAAFVRSLFLNSHNSSNYMNFATFFYSSSRPVVGFLHKLSANGHGLSVVTI